VVVEGGRGDGGVQEGGGWGGWTWAPGPGRAQADTHLLSRTHLP